MRAQSKPSWNLSTHRNNMLPRGLKGPHDAEERELFWQRFWQKSQSEVIRTVDRASQESLYRSTYPENKQRIYWCDITIIWGNMYSSRISCLQSFLFSILKYVNDNFFMGSKLFLMSSNHFYMLLIIAFLVRWHSSIDKDSQAILVKIFVLCNNFFKLQATNKHPENFVSDSCQIIKWNNYDSFRKL